MAETLRDGFTGNAGRRVLGTVMGFTSPHPVGEVFLIKPYRFAIVRPISYAEARAYMTTAKKVVAGTTRFRGAMVDVGAARELPADPPHFDYWYFLEQV